jgi:hypothetical protein
VVQRHLANVVRDRSVVKRTTAGRVSLSKNVAKSKCLRRYTTRIKIDG